MTETPAIALPLPDAVCETLETLRSKGHQAYVVGGCVRDLLRGQAIHDFDIASSASPEQVLEIWNRAVATGIQHGTVMLPTSAGPIDITSFRAGPSLEEDLARRDFTINAIAYDAESQSMIDPFDGAEDLRAGRLRAVRSAHDRFAEDPLRMLRAARLAATLDLEIDPELETEIGKQHRAIKKVAKERIKQELLNLMLAPGVEKGLALLQRTGLQDAICPGLAEDAPQIVALLPPDLGLRLAGWLRGVNAASTLSKLRVSRRITKRVTHLLFCHPVEGQANTRHEVALRRLLKRTGVEDANALLALRGAEAQLLEASDPEAAALLRGKLGALREGIAHLQSKGALALVRSDLAIQGKEVMQVLGCAPGPIVGRALDYLTECVIRDPKCNAADRLQELLQEWAARETESDANS